MLQRLMFVLLMLGALTSSALIAAGSKETVKESSAEVKAAVSFEEGKHYKVLSSPLAVGSAPVTEFFFYGCRTCYQLVPAIAEWSHKTGLGVSLVPAHSETSLIEAARLHHTFAEMDALSTMYELGYVIFQTKESKLQGADRINAYLSRHGLDQKRFWQIWESDAVNKRMAGSLALTQRAKIFKTPAFVVQGKYLVDVDTITSVEQLFSLLEYLVKKPTVE